MKIAVLGGGDVGRTLAEGLTHAGHDVVIGVRDPDATKGKNAEWVAGHPEVPFDSLASAAAAAELVVNATAGDGSLAALERAGGQNLAGKTLVDVANPLEFSDGGPTLFVLNTDSLAERIQRQFPDAHVVKALNTMTARLMIDPGQLAGCDHSCFVAGNDAGAKRQVTGLLGQLGHRDVLDFGDITAARGLEGYMLFWLAGIPRIRLADLQREDRALKSLADKENTAEERS